MLTTSLLTLGEGQGQQAQSMRGIANLARRVIAEAPHRISQLAFAVQEKELAEFSNCLDDVMPEMERYGIELYPGLINQAGRARTKPRLPLATSMLSNRSSTTEYEMEARPRQKRAQLWRRPLPFLSVDTLYDYVER